MSSRSDKVAQGQRDGLVGTTEAEMALAAKICTEHGVQPMAVVYLMTLLQAGGFGRSHETAETLRAVADLLESTIEAAETIEARLDGTLQ